MSDKDLMNKGLEKLAIAIIEEVMLEQNLADLYKAKLDKSIKVPTFSEVKKRFEMESKTLGERQSIFEKIPDSIRTAFQSIANVWNEKLIPAPQGALSRRLESVNIEFNERSLELTVCVSIEEREIEIYSADESLRDKVLVVYFDENEELTRGVFETDKTTEGMEVSCSLRVPQNLKTMKQVESLLWGITS